MRRPLGGVIRSYPCQKLQIAVPYLYIHSMPLLASALIEQQGSFEVVLMLSSWKTWSPIDKGVWGGWVAIITIFWLLFLALAFISGISAIDSHPAWRDFPPLEHIFVADMLFVACLPGLAGVAQWLLLRAYIQRRSWWVPLWVLATIIGWTGILVLTLLPPPDLPLWSVWIIGGAINSLLQWLVLRPYLFRAGWWALAQLGTLILTVVLSAIAPFFVLVAGSFYAALTGYVLVSLFRAAVSRRDSPTVTPRAKWSWPDTLSICGFLICVGIILVGATYWRMLWYLSPPPPPIYPNAATVIERTVGGRRANESYILVVRFRAPARGHQEQIVVLEDYSAAFREPVDVFFFTLRSAHLTQAQAEPLEALRRRWCQQRPTFRPLQPQEPFYDLGVWCREEHTVQDIQIPVDQLPMEVEMLMKAVGGADTND
jgi:hypothetical protein